MPYKKTINKMYCGKTILLVGIFFMHTLTKVKTLRRKSCVKHVFMISKTFTFLPYLEKINKNKIKSEAIISSIMI